MTLKIPLAQALKFASFIETNNIRLLLSYQVETFFNTYVVCIVSLLPVNESDTTPDAKETLLTENFGQYFVTSKQLQNI